MGHLQEQCIFLASKKKNIKKENNYKKWREKKLQKTKASTNMHQDVFFVFFSHSSIHIFVIVFMWISLFQKLFHRNPPYSLLKILGVSIFCSLVRIQLLSHLNYGPKPIPCFLVIRNVIHMPESAAKLKLKYTLQ